jgi:SAM-dependent methyltransferase
VKRAAGSGGSVVVDRCQVCDSPDLEPVIFVGFLPPVNTFVPIGTRPAEQPAYPAQLLRCPRCELMQLGLVVDPAILFPPSYAYTSGTTRILRENFAQLETEATPLLGLKREDLVVDIGSNDGTLLANFQKAGYRVVGIEPTDVGKTATARGIPTITAFFDSAAADQVVATHGRAKLVTATNVFAHIEDIHAIVDALLRLLDDDGAFISESHYWVGLMDTLQYDTIYHEHLRYYSLTSLRNLLAMHGLEVFHARPIPTHGGSIRVYATRRGKRAVQPSVEAFLSAERQALTPSRLAAFRRGVVASKLKLYRLLEEVTGKGARIYGIGAPSRAATMVNYVGLDDGIVSSILEIKGSHKIGKYMPGTLIPVVDEEQLFADQPEYALLFSWHIAEELVPKLRGRGYRGRFIVPLPEPRLAE